jgi:hypothetical protein
MSEPLRSRFSRAKGFVFVQVGDRRQAAATSSVLNEIIVWTTSFPLT